MKFAALLLLLALVTLSSVAAASYPRKSRSPRDSRCSNRCYSWRPSPRHCGPYCRPRRTFCRVRKLVKRCRYIRRSWGDKKVCREVAVYKERRAWKCRARFQRPNPRPNPRPPTGGPRPPFGRCMDKCKPYWSQAKNGCNYRFCHLKRCAVPWPRSKVRKYGWGCFYKAGHGHGPKPVPVVPVSPVKPPVLPSPKPDPYNACYKGCLPLHKARYGCDSTYCAVRKCGTGRFTCMPKLPVTPTPSPSASPAANAAYTPSPTPTPVKGASVTPSPSPTPTPCERICYPKGLKATVVSKCDTKYCRVVDCLAEGKGFQGFGCISKA